MARTFKPLPDKALQGYLHLDITCGYASGMNTNTNKANKIVLPDMNATEICSRCDDFFKPEDGHTNAYGSFHCEECSYIDTKLERTIRNRNKAKKAQQ